MKRRIIVDIISAAFILLFVFTAMSKLYDHETFRYALYQSPLISKFYASLAWVLPSLELIVAALLFFPKSRKIGLYSSLALMILFTGYVGYMISFTSHLPCTCGGVLVKMTWKQHLLFNIFFTLLATVGAWQLRSKNFKGNELSPVQPFFA